MTDELTEFENGHDAWYLGRELIIANGALESNPTMFSRHEKQVLLEELEKLKETLSKGAYDG